jgi:hypothetical protein
MVREVSQMTQQSRSRQSEDTPTSPDAGDQQSELARRLETGYDYIDGMIAAGEDVTKLEDFWIDLLHQYEAVCEGLAEAA